MGTSTILLDDGADQILVDGFFSRPGPLTVLFGRLRPNEEAIGRAMNRAGIGDRLGAVLVAHSHYDHVLDAPVIARRTGAMLVGSQSTAYVGRGGGVPERQIDVAGHGDTRDFGHFKITLFGSVHSLPDRYPGVIEAELTPPARVSRYREGGSLSFLIEHRGLAILVHPGANFCAGLYRGVRADVVFLAIGQLGTEDEPFAEDYWREVVQETGARLVIPIHWDNFTRSLERGLRPTPWPADNVRRAMTRVRAMGWRDGVAVRMMPLFEPVDLGAALPPPRLNPPPASTASERNSAGPCVR